MLANNKDIKKFLRPCAHAKDKKELPNVVQTVQNKEKQPVHITGWTDP
jgi:hypothetical protein